MVADVFDRIRQSFAGRRRILVIAGLVGVVLAATFAAFWLPRGVEENDGGNVRLKIIPDRVDVQIKDIHYTEVGDPDLTWEIQADTARYVKKDNLAYFDHVRIRIIRRDGRSLTLTGNEGLLHTDTRDADVSGKVVVVSDGGDVVETDRLHYSQGEKQITTSQTITLKNPRMVVHGVGMSLSLAEQRVSLLSKVRAVIKTNR
jgi:LPS export ABC transporter protein LptC